VVSIGLCVGSLDIPKSEMTEGENKSEEQKLLKLSLRVVSAFVMVFLGKEKGAYIVVCGYICLYSF